MSNNLREDENQEYVVAYLEARKYGATVKAAIRHAKLAKNRFKQKEKLYHEVLPLKIIYTIDTEFENKVLTELVN